MRSAVATGFALVVLARASAVHACRCTPPPEPLTALADSDAVFEARADAIERGSFAGTSGAAVPGVSVRFTVQRAWKGVLAGDEAIVWTGSGDADCGIAFSAGASYVVYARRLESGAWFTNLCSRTRTRSEASEDARALGPPASEGGPAPVRVDTRAQGEASGVGGMSGAGGRGGCASCAVGRGKGTVLGFQVFAVMISALWQRRRGRSSGFRFW